MSVLGKSYIRFPFQSKYKQLVLFPSLKRELEREDRNISFRNKICGKNTFAFHDFILYPSLAAINHRLFLRLRFAINKILGFDPPHRKCKSSLQKVLGIKAKIPLPTSKIITNTNLLYS